MKSSLAQLLAAVFIIILLILILNVFAFDEFSLLASVSDTNNAEQSNTTTAQDDNNQAVGDAGQTTAVERPTIAGEYDVTATVSNGSTYNTKINVSYLEDNKIEVKGSYKGISLSFTGTPKGEISYTNGTWSFSPYVPLLFSGKASLTFAMGEEMYSLSGSGSGTYFKGFSSGQGSGTAVGKQISATVAAEDLSPMVKTLDKSLAFSAPSKDFPTPSPTKAAAAGAVLLGASIISGVKNSGSRRRLKVRRKDRPMPTRESVEDRPRSASTDFKGGE